MKPWSHDAGELNPQDIPTAYIYKNQNIEEYLKPSSHERKLFLIGGKGCGKTLLIRYKANLYWNKMEADEQPGYRVSASNELVESLEFEIDTLSQKELKALANLQTWKNIWKFSLALITIRCLKIKLPSELQIIDREFPMNYRLSNIVTEIITNHSKYVTSGFFRKYLNRLISLLNDLNYPFILFIDRLDQALDTLLSNDEYKYFNSQKEGNIPFKVWQYAQCGLLLSSYNFTTATNRHIKIFATARNEALDVESQLMANITSFCTFLSYNQEELQEIFENNIKHTPKEFLYTRGGQYNPYLSFFGFEKMPHVQARDENQNFREEHVFKFLLRHTYERPREIVLMGRQIYEQLLTKDYHSLSNDKKIERVRREVNNTSFDLVLKGYLREVIPSFRKEYIEECAKSFEQNLIYPEDLEKIEPEVLNYLYRIGLIGYVRRGVQHFLPASRYIHDYNERIPKSNAYMLHPSLDHQLQQEREFHDFYNEYCIIGNGYPFYPPPLYSAKRNTNKDLAYYLPQVLPGRGDTEDKWQKVHIYTDPENLFRKYFVEETDHSRISKRQRMVNDALKILSTIANLTASRKLKDKFNIDRSSWNQWEDKLHERLRSFYSNKEYSKKIDSLTDENLQVFEDRIFGRILVAGILVYLDANYTEVRTILRTFSLRRAKHIDKEESAVKYLRQAFFLSNLPNTVPQTKAERRKLLHSLSKFERDLLNRWWLNYTHHILFEITLFEQEHKHYLKKILS